MHKPNRSSFNLYFLLILLTYFISRLYIFLFLKIDFSYPLKDNLIQYLDFELLRSELWTSIFYLHSQPPLFNFFIGINEIIFGNLSGVIVSFLFNLMGVFTAILAFSILDKLGVNKKLAAFLVIVYIISPATILYENLFFYTHVIIFFLVFSAYHLVVYLQREQFINAFLLFIGLALAVLTTSFFHLFWFLSLFLYLLFGKQRDRKRIIRAAILPFLIILVLYTKNYLVFEQLNTSSWLGLNLSRITVHQLDNSTKLNLIKKGHLSEFSAFAPFTQYNDLDSSVIKFFGYKTGIDVLDQTEKRNGRTNFNNYGYLKISKQMLDDDFYVIKNYPQTYLLGIYKAFLLYFDSPTKYKLLTLNTFRIKTYNKLFDSFIYGSSMNTETGYTSLILLPMIIILALFLFIKTKTNYVLKCFIGFAILNILYVMFVGNFLEYGENNRFRYYTEIFSVLLLGIILNELILIKTNKKN
ncbi:MAG TPA: phospholipid carrier-dependent glycosyltransferase [Ignavibacteriaceae bacterium]|nr:phospholipid carrier-dependent glycosyltransferase [Ignavibacteriaceae bacterium]